MGTVGLEFANSSVPPKLGGNDVRPPPLDGLHSPLTVDRMVIERASGLQYFDFREFERIYAFQELLRLVMKPEIDLIKENIFVELHEYLHLPYPEIKARWGAKVDMIALARVQNALREAAHYGTEANLKVVMKPEIDLIKENIFVELHESLHLPYPEIKARWGADVDMIALARVQNALREAAHSGTEANLKYQPYPSTAVSAQSFVNPLSKIPGSGGTNPIVLEMEVIADSLRRNQVHLQNSLIADGATTDDLVSAPDTAFNRPKNSNGKDVKSEADAGRQIHFEMNDIIISIAGQAAFALIPSISSDSPLLHYCVAATGFGFFGGLFGKYYSVKKPNIARILSKIGATGAASAVIISLGMHFPEDTKWNMNVVTTAIACLIAAGVVATS